jgi:hypothetical protein
MALEYSIHQNVKGIGVTGIVGAAPITIAGNTVSIVSPEGTGNGVKCLSARVYAKATTATLTITAKWQVSRRDHLYDAKPPNNAAHVTRHCVGEHHCRDRRAGVGVHAL